MIYKKIVSIMKDLASNGKIKREEITTVIQALLTKYQLVIKPTEVMDYKFINQEASFKIKYEIVDAEDEALSSIFVEVPGGGFDQEGKGRATYMASTGAYRQALQQLFSIQIDEELIFKDNADIDGNEKNVEDFPMQFDDFQETETNSEITIDDKEKSNTIEDKEVDELTMEDIDNEFADF